MKQLIATFAFLFTVVAFTGCSKDDDEPQGGGNIAGIWNYFYDEDDYADDPDCPDDIYAFNADGSGFFYGDPDSPLTPDNVDMTFTWKFDGTWLKMDFYEYDPYSKETETWFWYWKAESITADKMVFHPLDEDTTPEENDFEHHKIVLSRRK